MGFDTPQPGSTRSAVLRASLLALMVISAFAAARWTPLADWLQRDLLAEKLVAYRETPWAAPGLVALLVVFSVVGLPVSPVIFAAVAVFGFIGGWACSMVGCMIGAAAGFGAGHWLGRDLICKLVGPKRFATMTRIWDRHGFWTMFRVRFLPIPFPIVNYGAALAGVPFTTFFVASTLGLTLSVGVWTYLFHTLFEATSGQHGGLIVKGVLALVGILAISFLPTLLRRKEEPASVPDP